MLYFVVSVLTGSFILNFVDASDDHDHDHDEHGDCSCITGISTAELDENCDDADFDSNLAAVEEYLMEHECKQYCSDGEYTGLTSEDAFICVQVWALYGQYHDYCISGTVNETLFHEYLDSCPDCAQDTYQYEGAPDCDTSLNCTDGDAQLEAVNYVLNNCIGDNECDDECPERFRETEGYHRLCDHDDISQAFDEAFDQNPWSNTLCSTDVVHCNVAEEANHTLNCSSEANHELYELQELYGPLDTHDIFHDHGDSTSLITTIFATIVSVVACVAIV